jgi:diamine N-acetyltransferase
MPPTVELRDVTPDNWRACALLEVGADQRDFVMPVAYSLSLCHYGDLWSPLAACDGDEVVGFLMWATDPADGSCWIGGFTVDRRRQRRGYGRAIIEALVRRQLQLGLCTSFALSYTDDNAAARSLYRELGFVETGEREDDETVARFTPEAG